MTDNKFAKAVIENVWKWKKVRNPNKLAKRGIHRYLYLDKDDEYHLTTHPEDRLKSSSGFSRSFNFIVSKYEQSITIDFARHKDADGSWACNVGLNEDYQWSGYGDTHTRALHEVALQMACKAKEGK